VLWCGPWLSVQFCVLWCAGVSLVSGDKNYYASMWRPNRFSLAPGHVNRDYKAPRNFAFGVEEVIAMTAANDNMQFQEAQGLWSLSCKLFGYSRWKTITTEIPTKSFLLQSYSDTPRGSRTRIRIWS
jgi:hypothetical protein